MSLTGNPLASTADLQMNAHKIELERRRRNGAAWFYWVAGLSVVNSVILMTGGRLSFLFGLGITQVIDALSMRGAAAETGSLPIGALVIDVLIAGGVAALGYFALRGHGSAYLVGMVLYSLDGLLCVVATVYLAAGFHLFVLWSMWRGLAANRELARLGSGAQAPSVAAGGGI